MKPKFSPAYFALALFELTLSPTLRSASAQAPIELPSSVGPNGLSSLNDGPHQLLSNGEFQLQKIRLRTWDGQVSDGDFKVLKTEASTSSVTRTYSWGTVSCQYARKTSEVDMDVEVHNTSPSIIDGLTLQLLEFNFPEAPADWVPNYIYMGHNIGEPTIETARFNWGTLAACNDDIGRPLLFGFPGRQSLTQRPLVLSTCNLDAGNALLDPVLKRPIYPGGGDEFHLSLRLGSPNASPQMLANDILTRFAETYPPTLKWDDRRAIGALHLSVSEKDHHSPTNPRGWFGDPKDVDVASEVGRTQFRTRLLKYADDSIAQLKKMNAQGMIVWDIEGQEYPHATSYLGDPRSLPTEMELLADEFFAKFKAAGLRTGVCLRPQMPVRAAYNDGVQQMEVPDPVQILNDKIAYAHKRWGATLFYVDSNGDPNVPFDAAIFEAVAKANPDVLLIPEHENTRYYAYTAPYNELRGGVTGTPETAWSVYPASFSVVYVPDGDVKTKRAALVASVERGDVLMFRGWWDDPVNAEILSIYKDAGK
jgi:hypothetical protein